MRWALFALMTCGVAVACGETSRAPADMGQSGSGAQSGKGGVSSTAGNSAGGKSSGAAGNFTGGEGGHGAVGQAGAPGEVGGAGAGGAAGQAGGGGQGGEAEEPQPPRPNRVFVTSESYLLADLGGLPGADAACAARAQSANLPGTFVAWLSTSTVNAGARLAGANAWINIESNAFADQRAELLDELQVYYPIVFDESGKRVTGRVATGTHADGAVAAQTCHDYTSKSAADAVVTGDPTGGSVVWTESADSSACDQPYHLYCFEVTNDAAIHPTPSQGRTVFVSSQPLVLGAQGIAAADALCAADADAADLSGSFIALLPSSTQSALARLSQPSRPWVRPDGAIVANATSSLTIGPLRAAITEQADGSHVGGVAVLGTDDLGQKATLHCEDWTNPNAVVPAVIHGTAGHTDERWFAALTASCTEAARVLCVEP